MQTRGKGHWSLVVLVVAFSVVFTTSALALEVQLAGIRLDAPWVTVLDVYGNPDGVVVYGGGGAAAGGEMGGMMPGGGMPGMGGGMMPGMMGGPEMMGPGMMGSEMMMGPAMMGGGMGGMPGMGGPGMAAAGGGGAGGFPMWALPVWVVLEEGEVEWLYRKGDVVIGFVFNPDGYVRVIAVAGEDCDYARTALWRPHRYVKLGDDFKRVLYRYGYPDEVETFTGDAGAGAAAPGGAMGAGAETGGMPGAGMPGEAGMMMGPGEGMGGDMMMGGGMGMPGAGAGGPAAAGGGAMGPMTVTFNTETNVFSRDCVLTYEDNNNIAFTLHNMKVTRVHIWKSEG